MAVFCLICGLHLAKLRLVMNTSHTTLTGAAGEHFVMYRLLRMGYIAALAPAGVPNADIIVTDIEGNRAAAIQVKTRNKKGSDGGWHMKSKHEEIVAKSIFYCFVELDDDPTIPSVVYVMPSKVVADALSETHQVWLSLPGKAGRAHADTNMRRLLPDYSRPLKAKHPAITSRSAGWMEAYRERWDLIGLR